MPPLLGALHVIVLLLGVLLALLVGLLLGSVAAVLGSAGQPLALALGAAIALTLLGAVELFLRRRQARRELDGTGKLDEIGDAALARIESLGGEARRLALAARLGVPVPDGVVVPAEISEQWLRAANPKNRPLGELLPHAASAPIEAFLHRCQGGKVVLRPSFDADDRRITYAGVFPSTNDLAPSADERLLAALSTAAANAHDQATAAYRRRVGTVAPVRRAFLFLRALDADVFGRAESRGVDGAADSVVIDFSRTNSPTTSVRYDLASQAVEALAPDTPLERVPTWMHRLALLLVGLEQEFGGPVALDYAVQNGQVFVTSLQRSTVKPKSAWLSGGGPVQAVSGRVPRFVRESMGGVQAAAVGMSAALGGLGRVTPEQLRDEDGVVYLDFEALRPALGKLAMSLLAHEPLWTLFALSRPRSAGTLPELPEVTVDAAQTFRRFSAYRERNLETLRRNHYELVLRAWLVRHARSLLADGAAGQHQAVPTMHKRLSKLLGTRAESLSAQAERARADLERQDEALQGFVTALVTRGATDFSAMFVGDRQHHASLAELENWCVDPSRRDELASAWDQEKAAFASRSLEATPERLGAAPASAVRQSIADQGLRVVGLVPGSIAAPAHAPDLRSDPTPGKIVFLPDGRSEYAPHVLAASGVVLTGGGLASPMVALARELGIPTVACVQRKPLKSYPLGAKVALDGSAPSLRF